MEESVWVIKKFEELTSEELYALIKSRIDVFVVEQACAYEETDNKDQHAVHLYIERNGIIAAYARLLPAGVSYPQASIGRVLVNQAYRGKGYGRHLLEKSIRFIKKEWQENEIKIGAQSHLQPFYASLGFEAVSEVYLEDGIPHIEMVMKINE